jgi:RNA polymerase sigma factor (sigma-70 family)
MQFLADIELLRQYANSGSEVAFETLVNRRIGFVYSAALRQVNDPHLAEEITQAVFVVLARKGKDIPNDTALSGWLFNTTRFAALAHRRAAAKRWKHEREVQMAHEIESDGAEPLWKQISPVLDEALGSLREKDRRALLLRFFENKSLQEVGSSLAVGEDGARKRIDRALEKLHRFFTRRGISSTTGLLAATLSTHTVHGAPAALAKSVTLLATAQSTVVSASTLALIKGGLKVMIWSKVQATAVGVTIAALVTVALVQYQSGAGMKKENLALQQQVESLKSNNDQLSNQLAQAGNSALVSPAPGDELLRLRGENGVLRRQSNELQALLAQASRPEAQPVRFADQPQMPQVENYPKTAEAATEGIFDALSRGDLDQLFTNFGEPGVPKEMYEKMFGDEKAKNYLMGLKVISIGQPTNSFGSNMWFVPYRIRLQDGSDKEFQLHVAQDPRTQKWYFKGGL